MKLLVIGIDGGDSEIVHTMPMPFLQNLIKEGKSLPITEDLYGRGWPKIVCGLPAEESGAFYTKPEIIKHGCKASQSFNTDSYKKADSEPLWQKLNEAGYKIGFMNIPTTFPAPNVNGFFVSGAGGGLGKSGSVPDRACYPESVKDILLEKEYIFDTRFMASGIRKRDEFIERLKLMTIKRIDTYLELYKRNNIDVGFIAFMGPKCIQYLAMAEIEKMQNLPVAEWNSEQKEIASLYEDFDKEIKRLIDSLMPEQIMLVSDHGQSPYRHVINLGPFLKRSGMLVDAPRSKKIFRDKVKSLLRQIVPDFIRIHLSKSAPKLKAAMNKDMLNFNESRAFSMRYVPGIYINDSRFGGPVNGDDEYNRLLRELVSAFNSEPVAIQYGLTARPYRAMKSGARFSKLLPDIWIDHPDSMFFEYGVGQSRTGPDMLVSENPEYDKEINWGRVTRDQWTGVKGHRPLLTVYNNKNVDMNNLPADLCAAHHLILRLVQ